jgi:hypothetical protein
VKLGESAHRLEVESVKEEGESRAGALRRALDAKVEEEEEEGC